MFVLSLSRCLALVSNPEVSLDSTNNHPAAGAAVAVVILLILMAFVSARGFFFFFIRSQENNKGDGLEVLCVYQSEFINCSITFISLGYSGNISNYSLMGLSDKTNNLVIYCLVAWWAQPCQPNPFILPPISVIFFEGQIAFQEKWVNRCPLLEIANNVALTVFSPPGV